MQIEGGAVRAFQGVRTVNACTQTIDASPDAVFPLLCPIREAEWLDGWVAKVVHAPSGVAEEDGVYATEHAGETEDTLWVITKRDPARHQIEFVYFVPGIRVTRLNIEVSAQGGRQSRVDIRYTTTGLTEKGNREVAEAFAPASFERRMRHWEASMNHFLETGQVLKGRH